MNDNHALVVRHHWKSKARDIREQLKTAVTEADKQPAEFRQSWLAGTNRAIAGFALDLLDEILKEAQEREGMLPIPLTIGHHLILNGAPRRVIDARGEDDPDDSGRQVWRIVTEQGEKL